MIPKLNYISEFSKSSRDAHVVSDDFYYISLLSLHVSSLNFYGTRFMRSALTNRFENVNLFDLSFISLLKTARRRDKYVFNGFSEKRVLFFALAMMAFNPRISLLATNNFSVERIKKYRAYFWIIYRFIDRFLEVIVVNTEIEREIISENFPFLRSKVCCKRHHMLSSRAGSDVPERKPQITFMGPPKNGKPIAPFLNFICEDAAEFFTYFLTGVAPSDVSESDWLFLRGKRNVRVISEFLSSEEVDQLLCSSAYCFLTHDKFFEGKLSGNLCDAIATSTPVITHDIRPASDYFKQFGALGVVLGSDAKSNFAYVLEHYQTSYAKTLNNLSSCENFFSSENCGSDFIRAIFK